MTALEAKRQRDNAEAAAQQNSAAGSEKRFRQSSGTIAEKLPQHSASELRISAAAVLPN
jgi:hypothetical protein